jgi:FkbM family methyltransferase
MYSQNNEEAIIKYYFRNIKGRFLDIGANDGMILSNTLWCAENGWSGVCVEPSIYAFERLCETHLNHDVQCINVAVGTESGIVDFYESGEHLGKGDTSLLSTIDKSELGRWQGTANEFTKTDTVAVTWEGLIQKIEGKKTFDLISIDAEGLDLDIMRQIDFNLHRCKMLIIEYNQKHEFLFRALAAEYQLKLFAKNRENLIFVK